MLKFSPKIRLGMLINVMLIKKKHVVVKFYLTALFVQVLTSFDKIVDIF